MGGFFEELVGFMTSGPVIALKLEAAKKEAPQSIRALYASSMTKNASHGSDSVSAAVRELNFYFPQQVTLAMIKPDAVSAGNAPVIIDRIAKEGFTILESNKVTLTKERAEA